MHVIVVVGVLLALTPALARADAITMPASCPESSEDAFCHGPATCRPRGCISPTDCSAGEVCAARSLCLESHTCFGFPSGMLVDHVLGACDAAHACASGTCEDIFVCAPGTTSADAGRAMDAGTMPEHAVYCGCRAGARSGGESVLAAMMAVLAVLTVRRRR